MPKKEVKTVELRLTRLGKERWKEHLSETTPEAARSWLYDVIKTRGPEERGSYKVTTMLNGGYGRNPETGMTIIINWKGQLNSCPAWELFPEDIALNPLMGSAQ